MNAILLAAGFGTRLRPLTNNIPKCLVKIKGKPLLEIWLERLTHFGIKNFLINTHYLHLNVERYLKNSSFKDICKLSYEKNLLGTAGTLINNIDFSDNQDLMLIHADNYCLADFDKFINAHVKRPKKCLMTMMTFKSENPSSCGIVEVDNSNVVTNFFEKIENPPGNLANGAVYILSSEFLKIIKNKYSHVSDFSNEILIHFINKIYSYETKNTFIDIGTPENYNKANK